MALSAAPPEGFADAAAALGARPDARQLQLLERFVGLLLEENARQNLTAVRDPEQAWSRHVLDSLSLLAHLRLDPGASVIDVGAGGGLPGLPLAILRPDLGFTLVDATGKKVQHIARTAGALGLPNVTALQGRAEDLCGLHGAVPPAHRQRHDLAVCRALAPMPVLLELVSPFLKVGGRMLAIKGARATQELSDAGPALQLLKMRLQDQHRTPTGTVVVLEKTADTPRAYPRRPGEPKRAPIAERPAIAARKRPPRGRR